MPEEPSTVYGLAKVTAAEAMAAPDLSYRPRDPQRFRPGIGLIGCGGITVQHLTAYRAAGYSVVALCDPREEKAQARRAEFYPAAAVYSDHRALLAREDVIVVDIATHPTERLPLMEAALRGGKHVLSQKPFVLDLDEGERLAALADAQGVRLAVNQNGRWAPHFRYLQQAVQHGLIGPLTSAHCRVHWDHSWVQGTAFDEIDDLILYDFAIHWFDFLSTLLGDRTIKQVYATRAQARGQLPKPPLLAQALIEFDGGQASLAFDANVRFGPQDTTYVAGTDGSIRSEGPDLQTQAITLVTTQGCSQPQLKGHWFPDGFHGTMGELLCAIEEGSVPSNSARDTLKGLALCFAAIASARDGRAYCPGTVRRLPPSGTSMG